MTEDEKNQLAARRAKTVLYVCMIVFVGLPIVLYFLVK